MPDSDSAQKVESECAIGTVLRCLDPPQKASECVVTSEFPKPRKVARRTLKSEPPPIFCRSGDAESEKLLQKEKSNLLLGENAKKLEMYIICIYM